MAFDRRSQLERISRAQERSLDAISRAVRDLDNGRSSANLLREVERAKRNLNSEIESTNDALDLDSSFRRTQDTNTSSSRASDQSWKSRMGSGNIELRRSPLRGATSQVSEPRSRTFLGASSIKRESPFDNESRVLRLENMVRNLEQDLSSQVGSASILHNNAAQLNQQSDSRIREDDELYRRLVEEIRWVDEECHESRRELELRFRKLLEDYITSVEERLQLLDRHRGSSPDHTLSSEVSTLELRIEKHSETLIETRSLVEALANEVSQALAQLHVHLESSSTSQNGRLVQEIKQMVEIKLEEVLRVQDEELQRITLKHATDSKRLGGIILDLSSRQQRLEAELEILRNQNEEILKMHYEGNNARLSRAFQETTRPAYFAGQSPPIVRSHRRSQSFSGLHQHDIATGTFQR